MISTVNVAVAQLPDWRDFVRMVLTPLIFFLSSFRGHFLQKWNNDTQQDMKCVYAYSLVKLVLITERPQKRTRYKNVPWLGVSIQ